LQHTADGLTVAKDRIKDLGMGLRHLEWLTGEPVADPEVVVYEVLPYVPAQAERIIEHLCALAGLEVGRADDDTASAERVRQAFGHIIDGARAAGPARSGAVRAGDRQTAVARPAQGAAARPRPVRRRDPR
jgi:hypothetical protein